MTKPTLILLLILIISARSQNVFINEIRSNDASTDDGEFIELIGPAGFDISNWQIIHYNGSGGSLVFNYRFPPGTIFPDDGVTDLSGHNIGFIVVKRAGHVVQNYDYEWGTSSLQNGPDGILLADDQDIRIQALTWNGSGDLTGGDPAWRNIGSDQNSDNSLSAPDSSFELYQKPWDYVSPTPGILNANQSNGDISLPVQLSSFKVIGYDGGVEISWTTEAELDNQGFILERSFYQEKDFVQIASYESVEELIGAGNSSIKRTYHFTDTSVFNGLTYWYRLIDVSVNGVYTTHPPLSASPTFPVDTIDPQSTTPHGSKMESLELYQNSPNPFNPSTVISYQLPVVSYVELSIYNALGQNIVTLISEQQKIGRHQVTWDAIGYTSGIYYCQLRAGEFHEVRRMVLVK